jgi:hypothetical protein
MPFLSPFSRARPVRVGQKRTAFGSHPSEFAGLSLLGALFAACTGSIELADQPGTGGSAGRGASVGAGAGYGTANSGGGAGKGGSGGKASGSGATGTGGSSDNGGSGNAAGSGGTSSMTDPSRFGKCPTDAPEPGITPLSKLSSAQYRNTVRDLLAASGLGDVSQGLTGLLAAVPDDGTQSFRGLDKRISADHINAYFNVAVAVADAATGSEENLTALAGACATESELTSTCLDGFLADFGRRALRRPLTEAEVDQYRDVAQGDSPAAATAAEALRNVVVTLLMSPRFVNHLELDGTERAGRDDYLALNPYEIASRLSYTFWQTLPDDELLTAAEDGSLANDSGFEEQLDRVFADPRTQETIWQFWKEWFRFDAFTGFSAERPAFQALAAGEQLGEDGHDHFRDMVQEIRDLTDLYTWKQAGTYAELMTSTVSVTRSADLARLYGVKAWSGSGDYPTLPEGTRKGLLLRAAMLVSSLETTNPFHRGALIRRAILCERLQAPDPNELPSGALDPPPVSTALTTRQRFENKVEGNPLCAGCHTSFSDIGFALEAYDSLGRFRSEEKVFDEQTGELLATLPIDSVAEVLIDETDDPVAVTGPIELSERLLESGKIEACLSANYFRYALRRDPTSDSADACAFERMRTQLVAPGVGLAQVLKVIAAEPEFRSRKIGAR